MEKMSLSEASSVQDRDSINHMLSSDTGLKGQELEEYCRDHGLCPLCSKTRTRKKVFKFLKKNKWEPLTVQDPETGEYEVYKGYCVKPQCFTLNQAKRLLGEGGHPPGLSRGPAGNSKRGIRVRSVMKGGGGDSSSNLDEDVTSQTGGKMQSSNIQNPSAPHKPTSSEFPPPELKKTTNFEIVENEPLFVITKTVDVLKLDTADIQTLDLSSVPMRPVDVQALAEGLKVNTTLQALIMENCNLDDAKVSLLAEGLYEASDIPLVKLYIRSNQIGDKGMHALGTFFEANNSLEKMDVSRNAMESQGAVALFNAFNRNRLTRIRCINLSHNRISALEEGEFGIRPLLSRNRTLRVVNLEGNLLHDDSIKCLADGLASNDQSSLERLYLGINSVGDEGAIALAFMLERNTSLRVLGLGENKIHDAGARALLSSMESNTTIRDITGLWRNKIDRRFIIVAIRRLLMSTEPNGSKRSLKEQAPPKPQESNPTRPSVIMEIQQDCAMQKTKPSFSSISPSPSTNSHSDVQKTTFMEGTDTTLDRLTIFQSSPLAYFDRESAAHKSIPLLDFKHERNVIKLALELVTEGNIDVVVETATSNRFDAFFEEKTSHIMHFSCFGHPDCLPLENGFGALHSLPVDGIRRLVEKAGRDLRVVVVSSCHSQSIAKAFIAAGVPHVVGCQRDERFRDLISAEFEQHFYRALGNKTNLKEAFDHAVKAVKSSPLAKNVRLIMDRFCLLPEHPEDSEYHKVPVFFTRPVPIIPKEEESVHHAELPPIPQHFSGRDLDMYEILEALRVDDIVKVSGPPGHGKDSVVSAVCNYAMERRKLFMLDHIFWLPPPPGIIPEKDSLYEDLCTCINFLQNAKIGVWETDATLIECRDRIEIELENLQVVLVLDDRSFSHHESHQVLEKFISHILNVANAKVILITSRSMDTSSIMTSSTLHNANEPKIEEAHVEIGPLSFKSTAKLFGGISRYILARSCPVAHTASEFAELLEPAFISKIPDPSIVISQRRTDLYNRLGDGLPSKIIELANQMPKKDFIEMISVANRPEVFVDSLGALDKEIERRTSERERAMKENNYMRAMDLDIILEELEGMRPEFPTLEELQEEEQLMKADLDDAVKERKYDVANDLKKELLAVKKKIMREKRILSGGLKQSSHHQGTNERFDQFQKQVQSMIHDVEHDMDESDGDDSSLNSARSTTFAVNCDNRYCSFVVSIGEVYDFQHSSEATGIACWSNESCKLEGFPEQEKLLEYGGPELQKEISGLPIVYSSSYGPVRCITGNAVIIGPGKYGKLPAPCVILTVGPLSPSNMEDAAFDDDTDSLHYITTMLRSCYRSSLVLARHEELQALALPLLTTRQSGMAYEETIRVGLQTLVEEVKFSHLRDLHIVAQSAKEAKIIIAMLSDMGHREI